MRHGVTPHHPALPGIVAIGLHTAHAFPRHAHDQFGIGLMIAGAQRSWSGVGAVQSTAGEIITVNAGEVHDGAPIGDAPRAWNMLYLDPAPFRRDAGADAAEFERPALRDAELAALFRHAFAVLTRASPDLLESEEALLRLLRLALRRHGTARRGPSAASPGLVAVRQRLDDAPEQQVTLAELARLAGVSRYQLLRGFARAFGVTPHAYLIQRRVRCVQRLLAAGHPPAEAALRAGFADQSHMTRAFARQLGMTPARYRAALG